MEIREAYELSLKLWIWLFKNPGKWKEDSPYYYEIESLINECPLCEIYILDCLNGTTGCAGDMGCGCFNSAYCYWAGEARKSAAAYIASKIRRYMIKQGWHTKELLK